MILAACGTELPQPPDVSGYPEVPSRPQRAGDPAKGYDFLINGGYVTCGLPASIVVRGGSPIRLAGRTGDNAPAVLLECGDDSPKASASSRRTA